MEPVEVTYHCEDGTWWAESDQMPGFAAWGKVFGAGVGHRRVLASFRLVDSSARRLVKRDDRGAMLVRRAS